MLKRRKSFAKVLSVVLTFALVFSTASLAFAAPSSTSKCADTIYLNGTIVTVDEKNTIAEAVAVKDDKIMAVGKLKNMTHLMGPDTEIVNLKGNTMLPGFYDSHSHFASEGIRALYQVDLNSPPIGTMNSIDEYLVALQAKADTLPAGTWISGRGYDDTLVTEKRHPTRYDLDKVSTEHPIVLTHISGHFLTCNSKALEIAGVTKDTEVPFGGVMRIDATTGEPDGVMEETAMGLISKHVPPYTQQQMVDAIGKASENYAAVGVTTANDGGSGSLVTLNNFIKAEEQGKLTIRAIPWFHPNFIEEANAADPNNDMITIGGAKLFQDGSIQGYTGYLSEPYHVPFNGDETYVGYPTYTRDDLAEMVKGVHSAGYQMMIHGNGDAAIDDILYAYGEAQKETPREDTRHTIIHSQMIREDQLDIMDEYGYIPSFFSLHTYYWGDRHTEIFMGPERAERMSPAKSALDRDMVFTTHCDTPVVPQSPLMSIWAATNRISTGGNVIGEEQRIPVLEAVKSYTINAAYQNFEEDTKGSIEIGKYADFVILSDNPLTVQPETIKDIKVLQTIVGNEAVYTATKE